MPLQLKPMVGFPNHVLGPLPGSLRSRSAFLSTLHTLSLMHESFTQRARFPLGLGASFTFSDQFRCEGVTLILSAVGSALSIFSPAS